MPLGLFPRETAEALQSGFDEDGTSAPPQPSTFAGFGKAGLLGVAEGAAKVVVPLQGDRPPVVGYGLPESAYQTKVEELTPEEHQQRTDQAVAQAIKEFAPDPHTTGAAGEVLHGLASGLTRMTAGSVVAGPLGGAVAVGTSEGVTTTENLRAQGVDDATAKLLGVGQGLMSGVGALAPGGYGTKLLTRVGTGAAAQTMTGVGNRAMMHSVLADAGYKDMAQQYRALDGQAMITDAVLGASFGGVHHAFAPSVIDAAHTSADAVHVEDAAPGVPITPESRNAHVDNMTAAAEALLGGHDVPDMKPVETIANPAQEAARATNAAGVGEAAAEAAGEPVAAPRELERRADAIDSSRMAELRTKGLRNLTPTEMAEYAGLLDRDRLAAKVGGRRMQGVLNDDAYAEMHARGEALPVQGFIDMDMLKALNDTHGHGAGDEAIRTLGETLGHYFGGGNVFRRSSGGAGDEFIVQSRSDAEHVSALAAARRHLDNHTIRVLDTDGNVIAEKRGIGFSHGSGPDIASAERAQYAEKAERQRLGLRSDRPAANDGRAVSAKPAAQRGEGSGGETAGAEAERIADPVTQEAVDAATPLLDAYPDLTVTDENGVELPAREAMQRAMDDLREAVGDDELHKVAAACFGRMG